MVVVRDMLGHVTPYKYKFLRLMMTRVKVAMTVKWQIGQSRLPSANIRLNGLST